MQEFITWVGQVRKDPTRRLGKRPANDKPDCRRVDGENECLWNDYGPTGSERIWAVHYLQSNPEEFAVNVTFYRRELLCDALGRHDLVRNWAGGNARKQHCKLLDGPAKGLQAIVQMHTGLTNVTVLTDGYLAASPSFQKLVYLEGR